MTYAHKNSAAETPRSEIDTAATMNSVEAKQKQDLRCNLSGVLRQVARSLQVLIPDDSVEKGLRKPPGPTHAALSYEALRPGFHTFDVSPRRDHGTGKRLPESL